MNDSQLIMGALGLVVLVIVLFAIGPLLLIWSLNALFGLSIVCTWKTWFAGFLLLVLFRGSHRKS